METKPETFGVPTLITELSQPSKPRAVGPQIITPLLSACYGQTIMRNATHRHERQETPCPQATYTLDVVIPPHTHIHISVTTHM